MYNTAPPSGYAPPQQDNGLRKLFNCVGMTVLIMLLSQNMLQLPLLLLHRVTRWLPSAWVGELGMAAVYVVSMLLSLVAGCFLFACSGSFAFPMPPVRRDYLLPALFIGVGAGMVGNLASSITMLTLEGFGVAGQSNFPAFVGGLPTIILTFVSVTVLPAILEELLFRGILLQPLRRYGDRLAVVVSAFVFAICHPTLPQFIAALLTGLCLGVFVVRSGSLITSMVIHFAYNSVAAIMGCIAVYYPTQAIGFSWAMVLGLIILGAAGLAVMKRRFGSVWQVSQQGEHYYPARFVLRSSATSVPFIAAVLLCVITIARSFYFI